MASSNVPQYPMMFPASEWSNKYSSMNAQNFPMYNYYGTPTDAMGNPIDAYKGPSAPVAPAPAPGLTLNTAPARGLAAPPSSGDPQLDAMLAQRGAPTGSPVMGITGGGPGSNTGITGWGIGRPIQYGAQQAPQQQQAIPSSGFNYLTALANPNKVRTPGVYDYPAPAYQPDSASIDAILRSMQSGPSPWPAQRPGIGGGSQDLSIVPNSSFLNTLAALRAGSPSSGAK